ncbi:hypothetical protein TCAL_16349, partial [Tigriopus californicus]
PWTTDSQVTPEIVSCHPFRCSRSSLLTLHRTPRHSPTIDVRTSRAHSERPTNPADSSEGGMKWAPSTLSTLFFFSLPSSLWVGLDLAMGRTSSSFSSFPSRSNSMADIDENDCLIISENRPPPSKMNPTLGASTSSTGLSMRTPCLHSRTV